MKININDIRVAPKSDSGFKLCCYGDLSELLEEWVKFHKFETEPSGKFTNVIIPPDTNVNDIFIEETIYDYVDGFSPNLNKHLHIGHLSNLILAKAFQSLGIGKKFIAILGDTLEGNVEKDEAYKAFIDTIVTFDYFINKIHYASDMTYDGILLKDGTDKYEGTKIFEFDDDTKIVGIKSDGSTSYFYQDVTLASELNASTLYLTGNEQDNHFKYLNKLFPKTKHLGLGLVTKDGKVWSSRNGDVIFAQDIINETKELFNNDEKLAYNILAGQILKSVPKSNKEIKMEQLDNPKTSFGLYLSYTLARMKNTGIEYDILEKFNSLELSFIEKKSKVNLNPSILFTGLVNLCKEINSLYGQYSIKEDQTNEKYFIPLVQDLEYGMNKLGLFSINKV